MSGDNDKGIYVSVSTYLKGDAHDAFLRAVETEAKTWVTSEAGQRVIREAVVNSIKEQIARHFGWGFDKDPRAIRFQKIVADATFAEMLKAVGAEPLPSSSQAEVKK